MTAPNLSASSERVAPHPSEPAIALTAFWLTRQLVLSSDSLRLNSRMFYRKRSSDDRENPRTSAMFRARTERQGHDGDTTSTRPTYLVVSNECHCGQENSPAAIKRAATLAASGIFDYATNSGAGGRRGGATVPAR
jgi:hypothetical protein